jgi:hypothetical protein
MSRIGRIGHNSGSRPPVVFAITFDMDTTALRSAYHHASRQHVHGAGAVRGDHPGAPRSRGNASGYRQALEMLAVVERQVKKLQSELRTLRGGG